MSVSSRTRAARLGAAAALLLLSVVPALAAGAAEDAGDLKARMEAIRARLNAATARVEALREKESELADRIVSIEDRMDVLRRQNEKLRVRVIERADALYRTGSSGVVEVLLGAEDFAEFTDRAELISRVSLDDNSAFIRLYRSTKELAALSDSLQEDKARLAQTQTEMREEAEALQAEFDDVAAEYERLQALLARRAEERSDAPPAPEPDDGGDAGGGGGGGGPIQVATTGGMTCPVAGPTSFVDSWGAPRDGHTHQGVDMMGAYGTPLVAITSGTITYAAYDGSGGNMIFLSGDDGNAYWYMHNQENLVSGGHVSTGQQIATLGDTGNAEGTPHLHFEYHPGGGAAVNPYPLVAGLC